MSNNGELSTPAPAPSRPAAIPSIADGVDHKLHPKSVLVARLTALVWVAAIALINFIGLSVLLVVSSLALTWKLALFGGWALLFGGLALFALWWPGVRYRYISYRVDDKGLTIRRGVVWRYVVSIPRSRIQHTDVSQGPVQRNFEMATLIVHTAGTENASVSISGLPHRNALRIRDYLIDVGDEDAV